MVRESGICQRAEPCHWPGLKNKKTGEMTAKLGGVTTGAEIHHFEPAVNSNYFLIVLAIFYTKILEIRELLRRQSSKKQAA